MRAFSLLFASLLAGASSLLPGQRLVIQEGHRGMITCVAAQPGGKLLATGSADNTIKIWERQSGRLVGSFECKGRALGMRFSAAGDRLVAGCLNSSVLVLDVKKGRVLFAEALFNQGGYCGGAVSADGKLFAAGGDSNVGIYQISGGKLLQHFRGPQKDRFYDLAFSPDAAHLAAASDEKTVYVISVGDGKEVARLDGHVGQVRRVLFHPDGKHLLALVQETGAVVWHWRSGKRVRVLSGGVKAGAAESVALSSDGKSVALGLPGRVLLLDFATGKTVRSFGFGDKPVDGLAFGNKDAELLVASESRDATVLSLATGKPLQRLSGGRMDYPLAVGVGGGGRILLATWNTTRKRLQVRDLGTQKTVWASPPGLLPGPPRTVFSPGASHVALGYRGNPLWIYDLATGKASPEYNAGKRLLPTGAFALGPNGKSLVLRKTPEKVVLWTPDATEPISLPGKKDNDILSMAFSLDGARLALAGKGNYVRVRDLDAGKPLALHAAGVGWVYSLAFSEDGGQLLCGGPYSDLTSRSLPDLKVQQVMKGHRGSVLSVAFAADASRLLSVGGEGRLRVWAADSGAHLLTLKPLADGEWLLRTPSGKWEASAGSGRYCVWSRAGETGLEVVDLKEHVADRQGGLWQAAFAK